MALNSVHAVTGKLVLVLLILIQTKPNNGDMINDRHCRMFIAIRHQLSTQHSSFDTP